MYKAGCSDCLREFVLNSRHLGLRRVWKGGSRAAVQTPFPLAPAGTRMHPLTSSQIAFFVNRLRTSATFTRNGRSQNGENEVQFHMGALWGPSGGSWKPLGSPWGSMGAHGGPMGPHGSQWGAHGVDFVSILVDLYRFLVDLC